MENSQLKQVESYLENHNYLLVPKGQAFEILSKAGKPVALILFLVLSAILMLFFATINLWFGLAGTILLILAGLFLTNIFNEYIIVNTEQKSISFRSIIRGTKSIPFRQIDEIEWVSRTNSSDTNAFSDSNMEYINSIKLRLLNGQQKQLFSFYDSQDRSQQVEKVIQVFQDIFELGSKQANKAV